MIHLHLWLPLCSLIIHTVAHVGLLHAGCPFIHLHLVPARRKIRLLLLELLLPLLAMQIVGAALHIRMLLIPVDVLVGAAQYY